MFVVLALIGMVAQLVDGSLGMAYGGDLHDVAAGLGRGSGDRVRVGAPGRAGHHDLVRAGASPLRNIDWRTVTTLAVPGALGAFGGALVLSSLSIETAKPWMRPAVLSVFVLVRFSLMRTPRRKVVGSVDTSEFLVALGASIGFLIGLAGQRVALEAVPALLVGGVVAAPLAARLVRHVAPRLLGPPSAGWRS